MFGVVGCQNRGAVALHFIDDVFGCARRGEQAKPANVDEARQARFADGRDVWRGGATFNARYTKCAYLAGFDERQHRGQIAGQHLHAAACYVGQRQGLTLVRHVLHINTCGVEKVFTRHVNLTANSRRSEIEDAGFRLGQRDQLGDVFCSNIRPDHNHHRALRNVGNRREVFGGVERHLGIDVRVDRHNRA